MSPSLRNLRIFPLIILLSYLQSCHGAPAPFLNALAEALPSWSVFETVQTAAERVAAYGSQMLGYGYHEDDHVIVKDKPTLWDGHIGVPDFVSPLIAAMPDSYGYQERVVKGHDGRLGFRVAVPYFGDLQYIREYGPGRFTDPVGPGNYGYPGPNDRPKKENDVHYGYDNHGYHDPKPNSIYHPKPQKTVYPEKMYQQLKNYPWAVYQDPKPSSILQKKITIQKKSQYT